MHNYYTLLLFAISLTAYSSALFAQNFTNVEHWTSPGQAACEHIATANGFHYMAGHFNERIQIGTQTLHAQDQTDAFLLQTDANQNHQWLLPIQGSNDNLIFDLYAQNDKVYLLGEYWDQLQLGDYRLEAQANSNAIFLAQIDITGHIDWAQSISGTDLKQANAIHADAVGNVYITGYFREQLLLADTSFQTKVAQDVFFAQWNSDGELQWLRQEGAIGHAEGLAIQTSNNGGFFLAGIFDQILLWSTDTIGTTTNDDDIFLAKLDANGQTEWIERIGGLFDDEIINLGLDAEGKLYLCGNFRGRLELDDFSRLQSNGNLPNIFLLKKEADGQTIWARSLGSDALEMVSSFSVGESLLLGGYFLDRLQLDDEVLFGNERLFHGFAASFELTEGNLEWVKPISSTATALVNAVDQTAAGAILLGGAFQSDVQFDQQQLFGTTVFNPFIATINLSASTANSDFSPLSIPLLYPTTVQDWLYLDPSLSIQQLAIYDMFGRLQRHITTHNAIWLADLPSAWYVVLLYQKDGTVYHRKILKQ